MKTIKNASIKHVDTKVHGFWYHLMLLIQLIISEGVVLSLHFTYILANCQFGAGNYAMAVATLHPFRDDPALSHQAATLLVRAMHHTGQYSAGATLVDSYSDRFFDNADFCAAASLLYLDGGRHSDAALLAERAFTSGARPHEALVASATLALGSTDAALASERFSEALTHNPADGRSWSGLGMATMLHNDMAGAIPQLEKAVRFMPGHIGSWHALGWCRLLTQDIRGATEAFGAALALDRNFGESHGAMAVIAAHQRQRAVAETSIKTALRLDATCLSARYAQMVLSGEAAEPERFKSIALGLIGDYQTVAGENLAAAVERLAAH